MSSEWAVAAVHVKWSHAWQKAVCSVRFKLCPKAVPVPEVPEAVPAQATTHELLIAGSGNSGECSGTQGEAAIQCSMLGNDCGSNSE